MYSLSGLCIVFWGVPTPVCPPPRPLGGGRAKSKLVGKIPWEREKEVYKTKPQHTRQELPAHAQQVRIEHRLGHQSRQNERPGRNPSSRVCLACRGWHNTRLSLLALATFSGTRSIKPSSKALGRNFQTSFLIKSGPSPMKWPTHMILSVRR